MSSLESLEKLFIVELRDIYNGEKQLIAALPRMARQVILLAFEGEFNRQEAVNALGTNLVSEFSLERVSVRHTRIIAQRS